MMRASRVRALVSVCRAGERGYYDRGRAPVFRWLHAAGLVDRPAVPCGRSHPWEYTITTKGRAALAELGLCPLCGSTGSRCLSPERGPAGVWGPCSCGKDAPL